MDNKFYSEQAINTFVKDVLCQKDPILFEYYTNDKITKFRKRLSRLYKHSDSDIKTVVQTYITDSSRDLIRETIGDIGKYMRPMGDLIISGGEAFNSYFYRESRIITTDIDTKFTPIFKSQRDTSKYFGYIQVAKLLLWDYLGKTVVRLNKLIHERVTTIVFKTKMAKMLGLSFSEKGPWITRRFTLIKKLKQSNTNVVTKEDVLIDIELFAIDLKLNFFLPSAGRVKPVNIGGLLDIAFMRPGEVGFESMYSKERGMYIRNVVTDNITYNKDIMIAGKKFLVEDLYLMQSLGLRPQKRIKDRKRMFMFCKDVLKIKNIKSTDSIEHIYLKSFLTIKSRKLNILDRPVFTKAYVTRAMKVNPSKYAAYTGDVKQSKILYQLILGLKGANNQHINGYKQTKSNFKFNVKTKKWIRNKSLEYIKNESTYRPNDTTKVPSRVPRVHLRNMLYSYRANRNGWMPNVLVKKASMIPIVGLKNKSFILP